MVITLHYEFRWIEELGTNFIEQIEVFSDICKYSGEYLNCIKERDLVIQKEIME